MRHFRLFFCAALPLLFLADESLRADSLHLAGGGAIEGEIAEDAAKTKFAVRTPEGIVLQLAKTQVREIVEISPAEKEYTRIAPSFGNNAEQQWHLAQWCRDQELPQQREIHLRKVLELEPDHSGARQALGYSHVGGRWFTREEFRREKGLERYRGRWRLPQEIELLEREAKQQQAQKEWLARLLRYRREMVEERSAQAYEQIKAVRDPLAAAPLGHMLQHEPLRPLKMIYVETLGVLEGQAGLEALLFASLNDPDEEIFHACIDALVEAASPAAVKAYVKALKDNNNVRVNRAAYALGRLGDRSAISPLIDALTTTHQIVLPGPSSDAISTSFSNGGENSPAPRGTGMTTGGGGPRVLRRTANNQAVLAALVQLSGGESFGFDQEKWKTWLAIEESRFDFLDARSGG